MAKQLIRVGVCLAGLLSVGIVLLCLGAESPNSICPEAGHVRANQSVSWKTRLSFHVGKLMNFSQYKKSFMKTYHSVLEELDRYRLFLTRSIKVFIARLAYKHRRLSFYLAINSHSDWTLAEIEASRNKKMAQPITARTRVPSKSAKTSSGSSENDTAEERPSSVGDHERVSWSVRDQPNYKPLIITPVEGSSRRSYEELPVKNNFQLLEQSFDGLWDSKWFGSSKNSRSARGGGEGDIVWVDHRRSNCMQQVRDQLECGSCYAFTLVAFLEWAYCMETQERVQFSEQHIVDCGNGTSGLLGCDGGAILYAAEYILNFGLELASNYPYSGLDGQCAIGANVLGEPSGSLRLDVARVAMVPMTLFEECLQFSPIITGMEDFDDFHMYGGGVYNGRQCKGKTATHSVLIIGHGREDGEEFWLLRNSFGIAWGEFGYMKLNKNTKCLDTEVGFIIGSHDGKHVRLRPQWVSSGSGKQRKPLPGVKNSILWNLLSTFTRAN